MRSALLFCSLTALCTTLVGEKDRLAGGNPAVVSRHYRTGCRLMKEKGWAAAEEAFRKGEVEARQNFGDARNARYILWCLEYQIRAREMQGKPFAAQAAALLKESANPRLKLPDREHAQRIVFDHVWAPLSELSKQELLTGLAKFDAIAKDHQVPQALRSIGRLFLVSYEWNKKNLRKAREHLDELTEMAYDPSVTPLYQAFYFNYSGLLATEEHNYEQAHLAHSRALQIRRAQDYPIDLAQSFNNLGDLAIRLGDYEMARGHLREAARIYEQHKLEGTSASLFTAFNRSRILEREGKYSQSIQAQQQILKELKSGSTPHSTLKWLCLNNLGVNQYHLGNFKESHRSLVKAREIFGPTHLHRFESTVNLGWVEYALGHPDRAERCFADVLTGMQATLPDNHPRISEVMAYLARQYAVRDKKKEAIVMLKQSLKLRAEQMQRTLDSALSQRDRMAFVTELRAHSEVAAWPGALDTYLSLAPQLGISAQDQYETLVKWKGILSLFESPVDGKDRGSRDLQQARLDHETKMRALRLLAVRRKSVLKKQDALQAVKREMAKAEREAALLERKIRLLQRDFRQPAHLSIGLKAIVKAMPPKSALLDIVEIHRFAQHKPGTEVKKEREHVAFLLRSDGRLQRFNLGSTAPLDRAVYAYHKAVAKGFFEAVTDQRNAITKLLSARIQPALNGIELLIISGDKWLHRLPFASLPGVKKPYWIEEMAFAYTPSAHSFVRRANAPKPKSQKSLFVGGVDYGRARNGNEVWEPLKESAREINVVQNLFRKHFKADRRWTHTILTEKAATRKSLIQQLPQQRFAHIATHGYFTPIRSTFGIYGTAGQLDSGLVLAGANESEEREAESLLTAETLQRLDLKGLELLTLSACETGLGHATLGQGLVGLVGALDRAGVRALLCALWKVPDKETADLMELFYRYYLSTKFPYGAAKALQQAQIDFIRKEKGPEARKPFYWGAWQVIGYPGPLRWARTRGKSIDGPAIPLGQVDLLSIYLKESISGSGDILGQNGLHHHFESSHFF